MMQNPLVQNVLLFFGAYSLMTVLHRKEPFGSVLTVAAGVVAWIIWMLRYNRVGLSSMYHNALLKPVIDLVCQLTGEQPPADASISAASPASAPAAPATPVRPRAPVSARNYSGGANPAPPPAPSPAAQPQQQQQQQQTTPLMLIHDGDFTIAAHQVNQRLFGMKRAVDLTMLQLKRNLRLREKSSPSVALPPLGLILLIGQQGLGKRTFAVEIGKRLYRGDSVGVVDLGQPDATLEGLMAAAKSNPYQTFVLENIDRAPARVQTDLLALSAGQPLTEASGARVSFKQCCFFLLIHKDPGTLDEPTISSEREGFTMAADRTSDDTSLDRMLAQSLHGVIPFHLPEPGAQAEAVALLMDNECRKYQLTLESVSPPVLAREVQEISSAGHFAAAPARIARVMSRSIHEAIERQRTAVDVK